MNSAIIFLILRDVTREENVDGSLSNNEEFVGEALKDVRDKVVIATKFGVTHNSDRSLRLDSSPAIIRKSVDGSLKRLGVETIDFYKISRCGQINIISSATD